MTPQTFIHRVLVRRRWPVAVGLIAALGIAAERVAWSEEFTMTMPYPPLRNVYRSLRVANNASLAVSGGGAAIGTSLLGGGAPSSVWLLAVAGPAQDPAGVACPAGTEHFDEDSSGGLPEPGECKPAALIVAMSPAGFLRVGIGTTSPQAPLHIVQRTAAGPAVKIENQPNDPAPFVIHADGNISVGKQTFSPAIPPPNANPGLLDVNDVWVRAAAGNDGRWASELTTREPQCRVVAPEPADDIKIKCNAGEYAIGGASCGGDPFEEHRPLGLGKKWEVECADGSPSDGTGGNWKVRCCKF
ncbi:MAG: hypothetical protein HY601_01135 [Candidatus Omnitrophica bacterium]|nr:hypothetical protein [Candidatus Omnitrophota bacterium]